MLARRTSGRILAVVASLALVVTACGGDDTAEATATSLNRSSTTLSTSTVPTSTTSTTVSTEGDGAADATTRQLQEDLTTLGFYRGPIDGLTGPMTEEAIREFQTSAGIDVDGVYGPQTASALEAALAEPGSDVLDDPETVNAITVISGENAITFNNEISCVLGRDDSGLIEGESEDGTTVSVSLDGTASQVAIDGPSLSVNAPVTSVSNDQFALTVEASPPLLEVLVVLSFCIVE